MILGVNILQYYPVKPDFADYETPYECLIFETNNTPEGVIISNDSSTSATATVYNIDDEEIGTITGLTVVTNEDKKQITIPSFIFTEKFCGEYYIKIIHGDNTFYSELFTWLDDVSSYAKIEVETGKTTLVNKYDIDTLSLSGYIDIKGIELDTEIVEEGVDTNFGSLATSATGNIDQSFEIVCNYSTFIFLANLRIFEINGSVKITLPTNKEINLYNISIEAGEASLFGQRVICTVKYREELFLSNNNE